MRNCSRVPSPPPLYVKYDQYINDVDKFIQQVAAYLDVEISQAGITRLAQEAAPVRTAVDLSAHKRSGRSGQYIKELQPSTVSKLNAVLSEELAYWSFL